MIQYLPADALVAGDYLRVPDVTPVVGDGVVGGGITTHVTA